MPYAKAVATPLAASLRTAPGNTTASISILTSMASRRATSSSRSPLHTNPGGTRRPPGTCRGAAGAQPLPALLAASTAVPSSSLLASESASATQPGACWLSRRPAPSPPGEASCSLDGAWLLLASVLTAKPSPVLPRASLGTLRRPAGGVGAGSLPPTTGPAWTWMASGGLLSLLAPASELLAPAWLGTAAGATSAGLPSLRAARDVVW